MKSSGSYGSTTLTQPQRDSVARLIRERRKRGFDRRNSMIRIDAESWKTHYSSGQQLEHHHRPFTGPNTDATFGRYPWLPLCDL